MAMGLLLENDDGLLQENLGALLLELLLLTSNCILLESGDDLLNEAGTCLTLETTAPVTQRIARGAGKKRAKPKKVFKTLRVGYDDLAQPEIPLAVEPAVMAELLTAPAETNEVMVFETWPTILWDDDDTEMMLLLC